MAELDELRDRLDRIERQVHAKNVRPANTKWFVLPRPRRLHLPDPQEDVEAGPGIDVTLNKVSVDLATDPGLEFDAAGDAGKVQVKVDANRAMERTADGIGLPVGGAKYDVAYVNAAGNWVVGILKLRA